MKGVSFQNGVEFKVSIDGEVWSQGDVLRGRLDAVARNPGAQANLHVFLADGSDKKIKQKAAGAFQILQKKSAASGPLDWSFELPTDARILDKSGSLYIVYGGTETLETLGQLRLNIEPHPYIQDIYSLLNTHYRFVFKNRIYAKGMVEGVFDPPQAKEWAALEELVVQIKVNGKESIDSKFQFFRKVVDATKGGLSAKVMKREIDQQWSTAHVVHDFNNRVNKDQVILLVDKVIEEYRSTGWLPG